MKLKKKETHSKRSDKSRTGQLTNEDNLKEKTTLQESFSITNPGHSILKKVDCYIEGRT